MAIRKSLRITAAALALAVGVTGAAQAENFNIFSASKAQESVDKGQIEQVGSRRNAAIAIGAIGAIAGVAALAASRDRRYYCDPYYEYCGPRRSAYRYYYDDGPIYYGRSSYRSSRKYHNGRYYGPGHPYNNRVWKDRH